MTVADGDDNAANVDDSFDFVNPGFSGETVIPGNTVLAVRHPENEVWGRQNVQQHRSGGSTP